MRPVPNSAATRASASAARGLFAFERGEFLQQLPLLVRERRRHAHSDVHVMIAAARALQILHALSFDSEHLIRLRASRNAQRFRALDRLDFDLRP